MAKKKEEQDGVWRTIGGRRVFIRNGQSLSDAMKESGKFKKASDVKRGQFQRENAYVEYENHHRKLQDVGSKINKLDEEFRNARYAPEVDEKYYSSQDYKNKVKEKLKLEKQYEELSAKGNSELEEYGMRNYYHPQQYKGNISALEGKHIAGKKMELSQKTTEDLKREYENVVDNYYYLQSDTVGGMSPQIDEYRERKIDIEKEFRNRGIKTEARYGDVKYLDDKLGKQENEAEKYYSKLGQYQAREDLDMRKSWLDDNVYAPDKRKEYEDFYKQGEEYYQKKYGKNNDDTFEKRNIKTITQEEYDKLPKDYKGTLKELVDSAEFRGENKEELRKFYEKQGFNIEEDKTILENENGGTILRPVKVSKTDENSYLKTLEKHNLNNSDPEFKRSMLGRMESDIKYYTGNGGGYSGHLWAKDEKEQIDLMKALYNTLPEKEKPDWINESKIDEYSKQMNFIKNNKNIKERYSTMYDYLKNNTLMSESEIIKYLKELEKK